MREHLHRWGVVYLLGVLFVASWAGQFATQLAEYGAEQAEHGQPFEWAGFASTFAAATLENWQSEWAQLLVQAVFVVALADKIFTRSLEDMNALHRKIDHVHARLDQHLMR
jgi:hypothetical protein